MKEINCKYCKKLFIRNHGRRIYCSNSCRTREWYRRNNYINLGHAPPPLSGPFGSALTEGSIKSSGDSTFLTSAAGSTLGLLLIEMIKSLQKDGKKSLTKDEASAIFQQIVGLISKVEKRNHTRHIKTLEAIKRLSVGTGVDICSFKV